MSTISNNDFVCILELKKLVHKMFISNQIVQKRYIKKFNIFCDNISNIIYI